METVDSSLLSFIVSSFPRGSVFFAEDLEASGLAPDVIRWSLSRLVQTETGVVRLGRGIYCVPEMDPVSWRLKMPSTEVVAYALARRWRVRIAPSGEEAVCLAGFSDVHAGPDTWVSDGSDQVFHLQNGRCIVFRKRLSQKVFRFKSVRMRNLVEAMRHLGKNYIQAGGREVVSYNLSLVSEEDFRHDVMLAPLWIRELLREVHG